MDRRESISSEDESDHNLTKALLSTDRNEETTFWNEVNFSDDQKRKDMIQGLKEFEKATGIQETEYIQKLENCKSNYEIKQIEDKTKKASTKWYELQLKKSGLFEPINGKEARSVSQEMKEMVDWFSGLKLNGDFSMISTLCRLEQDLKPRQKFRGKLKTQSKFVQQEYFRRIGSLPLVGSKEKLLENVLKELKEVEDKPSAVQFEFKKKQKSAKANKDTSKVKKEVLDRFENKKKSYVSQILSNKEYFGGEIKQTPYGKIPETAFEFIEWFEERKSFAAMDDALKKLPKLIKERKKLFDERNEILQNALPKDRNRIADKTNRMRRHELEAFLPELRKYVRENSAHVAEYIATVTSARTYHVSLFPSLEKALMIRKFKLTDLESQNARLHVLREEIADRDKVVRDYFAVPSYLRNDERFVRASAIDREKMLIDAKNDMHHEQRSPFELKEGQDLDADNVFDISQALRRDHEAKRIQEKVIEEMHHEGLMKAAKVQEETYWKIFGAAKRADRHEETQKESYLRDLKYWVRLDQNVEDETDAKTQRQKNKLKFIDAADEAYDLGSVVSSGGVVDELQEINETNLKQGTGEIEEKLKRARYGEHVKVNRADGRMAEDPLEMLERLSEQQVMELAVLAITKLGRKHMGLDAKNTAMLKNSKNIQKEIGQSIIDEDFSHLKAA